MIKRMVSVLLAVMMVVSVMTVGVVNTAAATTDGFTPESTKIYFDVDGTGWTMGTKDKIAFHIFGGDLGTEANPTEGFAWGAKKAIGTATSGESGVFEIDPTAKLGITLNPGVQYKIIFVRTEGTNWKEQTCSLFFTTDCLGHVAYSDGTEMENDVDSTKKSKAVYWRGIDPEENGPVLCITSIGNVVGSCVEQGKTKYDLFVEFISEAKDDFNGKTGLENARFYTVESAKTKTEQKMIDDIGAGLGLTKDDIKAAFEEDAVKTYFETAGISCSWRYEKSTLPERTVSTEALTPTEEAPAPTETPTEALPESTEVLPEPTTVPEPTVAPEPTDAPIHYHDLVFVPRVDPNYNYPGTAAHYQRRGCGALFADATGLIMLSEEDLYLPCIEPPTEPEPTEPPTEAPWYPTETPIPATEPDLPHDPSNYIYLNVDGFLYEVEAGSDHTYSYYLSNAGIICGIDAVTTWDAPSITIVGDPAFTILGKEADLENPVNGGNVVSTYFNDEYGNINMLRFNYTNTEGADFSYDRAEVITFTIHVDESIPAGTYYINTYIKTLEGEEEEKQIFEGTDTIGPPVIRNGDLDGQPGEIVFTDYFADEQTYVTYSEEPKTFTVNANKNNHLTYGKFRSLYIDTYGDDSFALVPYYYYTKENGSLKLTFKSDYLNTLSSGDYHLKFVFSDGEAIGDLHIIEGAQPVNPDYPYYSGDEKIYFDAASAGWSGARAISFYIYEIGGEALTVWGSKNKSLTTNNGDMWAFDVAGAGVRYGIEYGIIFHNLDTSASTYDLIFNTSCIGDTAYANPSKLIENPYDSNKASMEARWNRSNLGPRLQITSIGNVVGETVPSNTTKYQMIVDFLASKSRDGLQNALNFNGKDAQTTIDDIASKLGLTKDDVIKAIDDARTIGNSYNGDRTDWSSSWDASRSTLPGGSIEPTEPPTDSYGYIPGEYYLTGSINGDNSGTAKVHKGLRFKDYSSDSMILEGVRLTQGDVVRVARYNGNKTFTVYPDGTGRDVSITQSGRYDFYFKPYELGNGNYWYITPSYLGAIAPYLIGDADGNEDIEVRDATFIQRCLAKIDTPYTKSELMRGDVDDSGDLEIFDVTCIQYYLANMKTQFPIGTRIE